MPTQSHKPTKKYTYTYSPELARIIFWRSLRSKAWKILVLLFDISIILSFIYLGMAIDSGSLDRLIHTLVTSIIGT